MAVQPQLWTLNGLSVELQIYRAKLAQDLATLPPDRDDEKGKAWLMARVHEHLKAKEAGPKKLDRGQEGARLLAAQADKLELELSQRRGETVEIAAVGEYFVGVVMAFRAKVLAASARLAPALQGIKKVPEIKARIDEDLHQALEELSKLDPKVLRKEVRRQYKLAPDDAGQAEGHQ